VAYRLEMSPRASRDLRKIPTRALERLKDHIDALAHIPRPREVVKLAGEIDTYRIRVGDYRVLYEVHDRVLLVIVLKVADRKEAYR